MPSRSQTLGRRALACAAAATAVAAVLALPGPASADGGVTQSVDVVLELPTALSQVNKLPKGADFDPDGEGPAEPIHKDLPTAMVSSEDIFLDLDYVLSSATQPSALLTRAGEDVCGTGTHGIVLQLGPATYQPGSSIVFVLRQGLNELARISYPAGSKQTQYAPHFKTC